MVSRGEETHTVNLFKRRGWWLKNEEENSNVSLSPNTSLWFHWHHSKALMCKTQNKTLLVYTHTDSHTHTETFSEHWLTGWIDWLGDTNQTVSLCRITLTAWRAVKKCKQSTCSREGGGGWKMKNRASNTCLWFYQPAPFQGRVVATGQKRLLQFTHTLTHTRTETQAHTHYLV